MGVDCEGAGGAVGRGILHRRLKTICSTMFAQSFEQQTAVLEQVRVFLSDKKQFYFLYLTI